MTWDCCIYLVFGTDEFDASLDLSKLNGENGFAINGIVEGSSYFNFPGAIVSSAGDINKDDFDDLIIGGNFMDNKSYVIFGRNDFSAITAARTSDPLNQLLVGNTGNSVMPAIQNWTLSSTTEADNIFYG